MDARRSGEGRVVVVTGASSGIGWAIALELAREGYFVHAGVRRADQGEALLRADKTARIAPLLLDVTDGASIEAAARRVSDAVGDSGLFALVNNAGFGLAGPLELQPIDDLRAQLEVNTIGVLAVTQAFLPMLRATRGRIVTISSVSGFSAMPFQGAYCATKHAVEALMDALRVELRPWGISVSLVEPGDIATPAWGKALVAADAMVATWSQRERDLYGSAVDSMRQMAMSPRGVPPERVATKVLDLLSRRRPPARALVGPDAPFYILLELLPTPLRDWLVLRQLSSFAQSGG